ncbi:MAG TPA: Holliday junction resolvase RuvX [Candidatus Thiothrix moscowensis]|uniref:Holliday junction resolvase RuvX n=1 Tax=unclassified Thiothrix TaxID=2636184 RepID=UPI001A28C88E|nr:MULTISPECIES: Holliday junction resolvase RuvX [unclassified Thiothrix]MBJ6608776.1 Holliday junction resolvase RuvX [Candidatus Thiothrix moscowensis]HRJ52597.1 Holliday junction resolvase RuvX [Candidatus Thiothrix moscowensis]HRJ92919.1 Holliday junction resolvase RuvX [Candidatus Thiothrix moscowensis]
MSNMTVLGFDYGKARIGVAVANTLAGVATPQSTVMARDGVPDWDAITRCLQEWKPARLVVGMPRKLDGTDSAMQEPIERFIRQLQGRYNLPVDIVSEQLSSREAEQRLKLARQAGRKRKVRKEEIDQVAAAIILESWMQEHCP